ncbi:hypothetical protein HYFRA_00001328 [Hymenoscyphus fraxineus]|uniref:2EXR domain-containing protein n=1 Tax=Hymenoscyphus fraxineus TaxID=746836 RepID=A0A9N9L827_9HELO|nr:hypothetical protein HYFRA_00001328 [Hymenoscyphus fraxineus]
MSSTTKSFSRFSSLPQEIRNMIWKAAAFPRIVSLDNIATNHICSRVWSETPADGPGSEGFFDMDHQPEAARMTQGPEGYCHFASRSVPILFLICKESHHVARQMYTKAFGTRYAPPSTWFNFELDTLYLNWGVSYDENDYERWWLCYHPEHLDADIEKVQNLALYDGEYPNDVWKVEIFIDVLRRFTGVRNVWLVSIMFDEGVDALTPEKEGLVLWAGAQRPMLDDRLMKMWDDAVRTLIKLKELETRDDPGYFNPLHELEFLEESETRETPRYCAWDYNAVAKSAPYHPVFVNYNTLPVDYNLWRTPFEDYYHSDLWSEDDYSAIATTLQEEKGGEWRKPNLARIPLISLKCKAHLFMLKQGYDSDRDARLVNVKVKSKGYESVEIRVSLLATFGQIVSAFCQMRGISDEVETASLSFCLNTFYLGSAPHPPIPSVPSVGLDRTVAEFLPCGSILYPDKDLSIHLVFKEPVAV